MDEHAAFRDGLSRGQYCTYNPTTSCGIFSGAPLLIFPPNASLPNIIGLISSGIRNDRCGKTDILTRVAYYIPWIEAHVWPIDQST